MLTLRFQVNVLCLLELLLFVAAFLPHSVVFLAKCLGTLCGNTETMITDKIKNELLLEISLFDVLRNFSVHTLETNSQRDESLFA